MYHVRNTCGRRFFLLLPLGSDHAAARDVGAARRRASIGRAVDAVAASAAEARTLGEAFRSAGAYGAVMASEYNSRPLVPEVLVAGDRFAVIRPRPSIDEMLGRDRIPDWLT